VSSTTRLIQTASNGHESSAAHPTAVGRTSRIETEQSNPVQVPGPARKLIESKKIVAMVGNISLVDCSVNHKYYEAKGFNVISAGIAAECYRTPNIAAVHMGARYSSDGAAQALVRKGAKKLAMVQGIGPGSDYREVMSQCAKGLPVGSFSQFGFLQARIATAALLGVKGAITPKSANAAIEAVRTSRRTCCASRGTSARRRCTSPTTWTSR
jgi:hypothetical protein